MRFILHVGVHRTGSTLVQGVLWTVANSLTNSPLGYCGPKRLRVMDGFSQVPQNCGMDGAPKEEEAEMRHADVRAELADWLEKQDAAGKGTAILSEENIIGTIGTNLSAGRPYPNIDKRLAAYRRVLPRDPDVIAFGLRSYGPWWTSEWNYIKGAGHSVPKKTELRDKVMGDFRGWPEMVTSIRNAFPEAELWAWQQEHLPEQTSLVIETLTGTDSKGLKYPEKQINSSAARGSTQQVFQDAELELLNKAYKLDIQALRSPETKLLWLSHEDFE